MRVSYFVEKLYGLIAGGLVDYMGSFSCRGCRGSWISRPRLPGEFAYLRVFAFRFMDLICCYGVGRMSANIGLRFGFVVLGGICGLVELWWKVGVSDLVRVGIWKLVG